MNDKWKALENPPATALKEIKSGRMAGKTDINPQWRYRAMTEVYGPCGIGWKWELVKTWTEIAGNEVLSFAQVNVYVKHDQQWSEPIPGIGGNKMISMESKGAHNSDECFKMATTDALSVALKFLGVASLIYENQYHESKYQEPDNKKPTTPQKPVLSPKELFEDRKKRASKTGHINIIDKTVAEFLTEVNKTMVELIAADYIRLNKRVEDAFTKGTK